MGDLRKTRVDVVRPLRLALLLVGPQFPQASEKPGPSRNSRKPSETTSLQDPPHLRDVLSVPLRDRGPEPPL
eukprot:1191116-Pyramimonas_sp.AAC.1